MFKIARKVSTGVYTAQASKFSTTQYNQKFIIFFGAPGVGKGTYAGLLSDEYKFNKISTGDEIRKIIKGLAPSTMSKDLISEIKGIVNSGKLVSDDIVINIVKEKLKEPESKNGVILDGFPRTVSQLEKYDKLFPIHMVINLNLKWEILLEKLMGRRTCLDCGRAFNVCNINRDGYEMEPLLPKKGGCDKCGGEPKLVIRDDDTEKVITERMKEYDAKTLPLINEYKKKGVLVDFEVKKGVKDYPALRKVIKDKLKI
jgi:adenylate kinase